MAIVSTRSGKVEGIERNGVQIFRGIPYAAPPVGSLRWQPPSRERDWEGVLDASKFSIQSAQTEFALAKLLGGKPPVNGEDSLYLNVYTPACDDRARPVLFWIHGGAFIWGSADTPWYDGSQFARHGDVVVVTINYRLGPFGFLHLDDLFPGAFPAAGNLGILDQIAALQWVRECVGAFGGDPERVTIFGESAGAASVGTLLGTPAARGLFHGAIAQSGAASWYSTTERATSIAARVIEKIGVKAGDADALLATSTRQVLDALPPFNESTGKLPFQPVVDGVTLPEPPLDAIASGNAAGVPLVTGTNLHEMTLFLAGDSALATLDDARIAERVRMVLGEAGDEIVAGYRERRPGATPQELWLDIATDVVFRLPAIQMITTQLAHAPAWSYLFTWESPVFGGFLRSTHALEIPFVFDNLNTKDSQMFTGTAADRQPIADAMHRAWIAFAQRGDPNHPGIPAWPSYDTSDRATMRFDTTVELLHDPGRADRAAVAAALG
jgi:para-nitrobenzyl esterase